MNKIQGTLLGILQFFFGVLFTWLIWDTALGFFNLIDSTFLQIIWILGLLGVWTFNIVVVPYLLIIGNSGIKWINGIKGAIVFTIASFCCYLSYYIIPPIIVTLNAITDFGDLSIVGNIIWVALIVFWIIALTIYPIVVILKGGIKSEENE